MVLLLAVMGISLVGILMGIKGNVDLREDGWR
jgi:hypothetical protein